MKGALGDPDTRAVENVPWSWSPSRTKQINARGYVRRGRHRKSSRSYRELVSRHGMRLASFSLIGFAVFAAGLAVQVLLVRFLHIPKVPAYAVQLILSVQVNFLANYRWTWGDVGAPFWRSCWRYNIKRGVGVLLNLGIYPLLIHAGMNYLSANALLVVALTPANYLLGHFWTFAARGKVPDRSLHPEICEAKYACATHG
jgi:putative flippase GtrA